MATKNNVTKIAAPKAEKAAAPVQIPEKKSAHKAEKSVVTPQEPMPDAASISTKSTKTASKTKPQATTTASEPKPESIPKTDEKPAGTSKIKDAVGLAAPQAPAVVAQDQKWQEIRAILEKLKEDTLREIRKSVKNGTEAVAAIEPGGDIYDQASSERDRELGLLLGDREREKIHSIDEALMRIDEGEYGICEECDEDIPLGRLKAMPFTRHCVKCKSDLEKLQAQTKRVEEDRAYREIPLGSEEEE